MNEKTFRAGFGEEFYQLFSQEERKALWAWKLIEKFTKFLSRKLSFWEIFSPAEENTWNICFRMNALISKVLRKKIRTNSHFFIWEMSEILQQQNDKRKTFCQAVMRSDFRYPLTKNKWNKFRLFRTTHKTSYSYENENIYINLCSAFLGERWKKFSESK